MDLAEELKAMSGVISGDAAAEAMADATGADLMRAPPNAPPLSNLDDFISKLTLREPPLPKKQKESYLRAREQVAAVIEGRERASSMLHESPGSGRSSSASGSGWKTPSSTSACSSAASEAKVEYPKLSSPEPTVNDSREAPPPNNFCAEGVYVHTSTVNDAVVAVTGDNDAADVAQMAAVIGTTSSKCACGGYKIPLRAVLGAAAKHAENKPVLDKIALLVQLALENKAKLSTIEPAVSALNQASGPLTQLTEVLVQKAAEGNQARALLAELLPWVLVVGKPIGAPTQRKLIGMDPEAVTALFAGTAGDPDELIDRILAIKQL